MNHEYFFLKKEEKLVEVKTIKVLVGEMSGALCKHFPLILGGYPTTGSFIDRQDYG